MSLLRRVVVILVSFLALFVLYACSAKPDFDLIVEPETLELEVSSPKNLSITVNRKNLGAFVPIRLELEEPHDGLSAPAVTLTGSSTPFTITASQEGPYNLTLKASTDTLSKSANFTLKVVKAKGFSVSATPSSLNLELLEKAFINIEVSRIDIADSEAITVQLKDPPAALVSTPTIITGSLGTLELSAAQVGSFDLILQAMGGGLTKEIPLSLKVSLPNPKPSFELSLEPSSLQLTQGSTRSIDVFVTRKNGFDQAININASDLPTGVSAPNISIAPNVTSGLFEFSASSDAVPGNQDITLNATSSDDTISDSSSINLSILKTSNTTLVKEVIAKELVVPWDLTFTPSGTLYFTEREGNIKKIVNGSIVKLSHPLNVFADTESGLMGLTFNPDYPQQPYLYTCYSYLESAGVIKNRISRLTVQANTLSDEMILLNAIPGSTNHDGCRIIFGPDGKLYASMGDARVSLNAQDTQSLSGKILRINADGSVPTDNPFGNPVWSYGHRNPQGLAFNSFGLLMSSEHGDASDDEVNLIRSGRNYGWPLVEGRCDTSTELIECDNKDIVEPLTIYTPTLAVSGLAYYNHDMFPDWKGDLLMASLKAGQLYHLDLNPAENVITREDLIIDYDYGRIRDIEVAPDGSIYIATSNRDGRGQAPFPGLEDDCIIRWSQQ
jgi:aldose sugar dehydrogenase